MDLQNLQLQQLTNWLDVTEARIKRIGSQPLGPDLEDIKHQVEEHKVGTSWRVMSRLVAYNTAGLKEFYESRINTTKGWFRKTLFKDLFLYLQFISKVFVVNLTFYTTLKVPKGNLKTKNKYLNINIVVKNNKNIYKG